MPRKEPPIVNCTFGEYGGKNKFYVSHPAHTPILVAAPDEDSAMVAAADYWGERWQSYSYYPYVTVNKA